VRAAIFFFLLFFLFEKNLLSLEEVTAPSEGGGSFPLTSPLEPTSQVNPLEEEYEEDLTAPFGQPYSREWLKTIEDLKGVGLALLKEGRYLQARELLELAEGRYPGDPSVREGLSQVYARLGEEAFFRGQTYEASYFWEESLKRNSYQTKVRIQLARAYLLLNRPHDVLQVLTGISGNGDLSYLRGKAYLVIALSAMGGNDLRASREALDLAKKWIPDSPDLFYGLGRYYHLQKNCKQAIPYLQKGISSSE